MVRNIEVNSYIGYSLIQSIHLQPINKWIEKISIYFIYGNPLQNPLQVLSARYPQVILSSPMINKDDKYILTKKRMINISIINIKPIQFILNAF